METARMRHRAESILKIASTCIIFSAHVLSLYDQTDFALFKLSVFALDLVVKPRGENFVLRSEGGAKDFYPALATIESWGEWFSSENSCRRTGLDSDVSDPVADTSSALNRVPPL